MLTLTDLEGIYRSWACTKAIGEPQASALFATCRRLLEERAQLAIILDRLPASWSEVRAAMNDLQKLMH